MEEYSTSRLPSKAKVDYWNQVHCSIFTDVDVVPGDVRGFEARIERESFGPLCLNKVTSAPVKIRRAEEHLCVHSSGRFHILQALSGQFRFSQGGREVLVREGDFTISDVSLPSITSLDSNCSALVITMPGTFVRRHIPYPERLAGLHISGQEGIGHMASYMIRSLWEQVQTGMGHKIDPKIAGSLLDVVGASYTARYGDETGGTAVTDIRRMQFRRYIEVNLRDPDLTPGKLADAFRISPRYVRMLFAQDGETVSGYILRRRLEECAQQMRDVAWHGKTITEIAFDWGFSSMAHFSRVFREQYGVSPRQYREEHGLLPA